MIKEFTIGFSRTVNLGNYNSAKVEAQVTLDVPAGTSQISQSTINIAQSELRMLLESTWQAQFKPVSAKELKAK